MAAVTCLCLSVLAIFVFEIILKWAEHFWAFWASNWNVTDFVVTLFSLIFEVMRHTFTVSRSSCSILHSLLLYSNRPSAVVDWTFIQAYLFLCT